MVACLPENVFRSSLWSIYGWSVLQLKLLWISYVMAVYALLQIIGALSGPRFLLQRSCQSTIRLALPNKCASRMCIVYPSSSTPGEQSGHDNQRELMAHLVCVIVCLSKCA